ncbi:MAG: DNA primase [Bauldia sp.]
MRFSDAFLDDIRARLPVSAVVGRKVRLRKQGRELAGLSPFNAEKTPSFFVNDGKGKWFDFSAQKNGDIFTFVMETEGLSFPEAVERLANEAGVPMPARDPGAEAAAKARASLYDVLELAAKFFEESLQGRAGAAARGYLASRDIGPELQRRFRIGYAPSERAALKEHLAGKGIGQDQMDAAGLIVTGDDVPVSFDRFRDRVIFPIADFKGRVVGFGGRALSADVPAKYLNSPETDLFHKGSLLYNGAAARQAVHDAGTVIAVEGYIDAIRMVAAGFLHTVAPLGTALTERQLEILWRMADEPILAFDGDAAGLRAAHRAADLALPLLAPGKSLRFALLPAGQDPDDLIRVGGREAMASVLAGARPLVDTIWARETEAGVFDTPERRAQLEARLSEFARSIGDDSVRRHYGQAFTERVAAFFGTRSTDDGGRRTDGTGRRRGAAGNAFRPLSSVFRPSIPVSDRLRRSTLMSGAASPLREAVLVMTMVNHPALIAAHLDDFAHLELSRPDLGRLRSAVLEIVAAGEAADAEALIAALGAAGFSPLIERLRAQIEAIGHWPATPKAAARDAEEGWLQALTLHRRKRTLHRELRDAEAALADEPSEANLARLVDIRNELVKSEGTEALIEGFGASSGRQVKVY